MQSNAAAVDSSIAEVPKDRLEALNKIRSREHTNLRTQIAGELEHSSSTPLSYSHHLVRLWKLPRLRFKIPIFQGFPWLIEIGLLTSSAYGERAFAKCSRRVCSFGQTSPTIRGLYS